jgi:alkanesulfonate monooxygenase SsuD/methylene tetrahydromethanopterin reductase-like flavin-dependent oxidoreductase (luciferase family)
VTVEGTHYRTKDAELRPAPWRHDMPVLIAAFKPRMLRLTATYANAWNTAWLGDAAVFTERVAELQAACDQVGRDIAEITLTAGVSVEVGEPDPDRSDEERRKSIKGGEAEIAAALQGFKDAGCAHVIASLDEVNADTIGTLASAAKQVR